MAVRRFDASDDLIVTGTGAAALTGAYSIAFVVKFEGGNAAWHSPIGFLTSGGLYRASVSRDTSNHYRIDHHQGSPSFRDTSETFVIADGWHLFIVTHAAGTSTPRFHWFQEADGSMVHADAGGTLGHPLTASGGSIRFGAFAGGDPMNALLARAAVWDGTALSDGACESLMGATKAEWAAVTGITHLWQFDQASVATTVLDEVGNCDETSITGTAVVTTDDPPSDIIDMSAGGTHSMTLTPVTETDAAQTLSKTHIHFRTITPALQTNTAQALTKSKKIPLVPATSTQTAIALTKSKRLSVTPATSTNTAIALTRVKQVVLVPGSETDEAQVLDFSQAGVISKTLTPVVETDSAQTLVAVKTIYKTIVSAGETDNAITLLFTGGEAPAVTISRAPIVIGRF